MTDEDGVRHAVLFGSRLLKRISGLLECHGGFNVELPVVCISFLKLCFLFYSISSSFTSSSFEIYLFKLIAERQTKCP